MSIVTPGVVPASILVTGKRPKWLKDWAGFAQNASFEALPEAVVDRARLVVLDSIGAMLAGRMESEVQAATKRLKKAGRVGKRGNPFLDAFLGGTAGTMLEIDEGNQYARGHPGIHVVPAVLATGKHRAVSGKAAILATALGYEIGARIGIASKLRVTMHPHGTWGVVGAALAVAKLHKASRADLIETINVASSLGLTTSRRTMLEGGTVRNTYAGFSNMLGMMAWELVQSGFTGEADGIGAVYGGIAATDFQPSEMMLDLGTRWEIARNYFKRHAACRYTHAALDALEDIIRQAGRPLTAAEIDEISVKTYVWAAQLDHPAPDNMLAAKFSLPFALATTIQHGAASLHAFRKPAYEDSATLALAQKVRVDEDPALTAKLPALRPAQVRVKLKDGREFFAEALTNKGDTEDPYTRDDVIAKFREVADPVIGHVRAEALVQACLTLDGAASITPLLTLMEGAA